VDGSETEQRNDKRREVNVQSTSTVLCKYSYEYEYGKGETSFGGPLGGGGGFTGEALRCPVLSTKKRRERDPNESNLRKCWISHSLTLPPRLGVENAGVKA